MVEPFTVILSDGPNVEVLLTQATEAAISSVPATVRTSFCVRVNRHSHVLVVLEYEGVK